MNNDIMGFIWNIVFIIGSFTFLFDTIIFNAIIIIFKGLSFFFPLAVSIFFCEISSPHLFLFLFSSLFNNRPLCMVIYEIFYFNTRPLGIRGRCQGILRFGNVVFSMISYAQKIDMARISMNKLNHTDSIQ